MRPRPEANTLAEREGVDIRTYRVIYRAIEDVRDALVGLLEPDIVEDVIGQLEVRATFRASRIGTIAGCYVTEGVVRRNSPRAPAPRGHRRPRGPDRLAEALQRGHPRGAAGFECGVLIEDFNDVKEGDQIEVYELREVARTAQAAAPVAAAPAASASSGADESEEA